MKHLFTATFAEYLKHRKSMVFFATMVFFVCIPFVLGLVVLLTQHPEIIEKLGIIGTKAELLQSNDWKGYLDMLSQMNAIISMIGFGFVITWIFGSEHIDKTLTGIIALPVKRKTLVSAKFIVAFFWCLLLGILLYAAGIIFGFVFGVPEWSWNVFRQFSLTFFAVSLLTWLISLPVAFVTNWSRGIFAPIAFTIVCLIMAQMVVVLGLGSIFPWAVPGLLSVKASQIGIYLNSTSYLLVIVTGMVGFWATARWYLRADHH